jgi:hypothetical protein
MDSNSTKTWFRGAGILGVVGAVIGAISDHFLMSAEAPVNMLDSWTFFQALMRQVDPDRMLIGHFLGVFGIPLCIFGFWQIYQGMRPAGRATALPLLWASIAVCVLGVAYHVQLAYIGHGLRLADALVEEPTALALVVEMNSRFADLIVPLQHVIVGLLAFLSVWMTVGIARGATLYPRWLACLSPLALCGIFYGLAQWIDGPLGVWLAVAGLNLTSATLFAISTLVLWDKPIPE